MKEYLLHVRSVHEYNVCVRANDKKEALRLAHDYDKQLEKYAAIDWYGHVTARGVVVSEDDFDFPVDVYDEAKLERLKQEDEK